jgi:hypothetical protein
VDSQGRSQKRSERRFVAWASGQDAPNGSIGSRPGNHSGTERARAPTAGEAKALIMSNAPISVIEIYNHLDKRFKAGY